jgi:hypothetical protein
MRAARLLFAAQEQKINVKHNEKTFEAVVATHLGRNFSQITNKKRNHGKNNQKSKPIPIIKG